MQSNELLDAQAHIWNHIYSFVNSMALKCAVQLRIPDAIHKHGNPITLSELANSLNIPRNKIASLHRLMRLLVHSKFFTSKTRTDSEEQVFDLTMISQLLLENHPMTLVPFVINALHEVNIEPSLKLSSWFQSEVDSPFHVAHGRCIWDYAALFPEHSMRFNQAMMCDSQFVTSILMNSCEFKGLIEGKKSLVDVAGGYGTMAKAIAQVFINLKCIVLDQPHVIKGLKGNGKNLVYVGGDMLETIPPAQVMLLKWILHDWSDDDCIKILRRCKEAIPSEDEGGKVIIIEMVVNKTNPNLANNYKSTQYLFDVKMMTFDTEAKERTEKEWEKLFLKAGFNEYKIYPILGTRSVIEVYPS